MPGKPHGFRNAPCRPTVRRDRKAHLRTLRRIKTAISELDNVRFSIEFDAAIVYVDLLCPRLALIVAKHGGPARRFLVLHVKAKDQSPIGKLTNWRACIV